jgi:hypothetical protein
LGLAKAELVGQKFSNSVSVKYADSSKWNKYKNIRLKNKKAISDTTGSNPPMPYIPAPSAAKITPKEIITKEEDTEKYNTDIVPEPKPVGSPLLGSLMQCPEAPSFSNGTGVRWYLCNLNIDSDTYYTPYGVDFPISYMIPKESNFQDARIRVYLHPDERGSGSYVKGSSSFAYRQDTIEIHPAESHFGTGGKYTGWWGYSGHEVGKVANYNGRQIVAAIDYILEKYPTQINLNKGIYLVGQSLGGAGVMHQQMILPKYQNKIAIVDGIIAKMMIPKNDISSVKRAWGTPANNQVLYDSADIRLQWAKVKDIHINWRGGSNDGLGRYDLEFLDICEQHKIRCSMTWLLSGHGLNEAGYSLNMQLWTDSNQDATLDKILPVLTNNSTNYHNPLRGWHNRGVTWNWSGIVDTVDKIVIPLKYEAMVNLGPDLPDQPNFATFSITPRHIRNFVTTSSNITWIFGGQSGTASVGSDGLITIDRLELTTGTGYQNLIIREAGEP